MTYQETIDFIYSTAPMFQSVGSKGYKEGLEGMINFAEHLDNPQRKFRSVHIGGTNGKGSTSHTVASVLMHAGYKVGLYTSPHLKDFRERIRIQGQMITEQAVIDFISDNADFIETSRPSFFEITTAMAFSYFTDSKVDIAIIEVGLGGRLDSTNIIKPIAAAITNISFDHTQYLGDTIEKIATEKAGIIKPYTPIVIGESDLESQLVFIQRARDLDAPILFADQMYRISESHLTESGRVFTIENLMDGAVFNLTSDLRGLYQNKNILTALALLDILRGDGGVTISAENVRSGVSITAQSTSLMGRWQRLDARSHILGSQSTEISQTSSIYKPSEFPKFLETPQIEHKVIPTKIICDTGHNCAGIAEIVAQLKTEKYSQLYFVIGMVADKDIEAVLVQLPKNAHYIFTQASIPRAMDCSKLAALAANYNLHGDIVNTVTEALNHAQNLAQANDLIFVGGSTFVVAEII